MLGATCRAESFVPGSVCLAKQLQLTEIISRTCCHTYINMLIIVHILPLLPLLPIVHILTLVFLLPLILLISLIHNTPHRTPSSNCLCCTTSPPKSKVTTQPRFYCFILQRYPIFKDNTCVLTIYIKHKGFCIF